MHTRGLARFHRRNAPPAGPQGRSRLRPLDPRRYGTRRAAAVPRGAARPGPGDQPAPLGAALQTAGPVEGLTAAAARRTPQTLGAEHRAAVWTGAPARLADLGTEASPSRAGGPAGPLPPQSPVGCSDREALTQPVFTDEWSGQRQSAAIRADRGQPVDQGGDPERAGEAPGRSSWPCWGATRPASAARPARRPAARR